MAENENTWQKGATLFLVGVGVGAGLALLFAPKSGEETRDQMVGAAKDFKDEVLARGVKAGRRARKALDDAQADVEEAIEAGGQAFREARSGRPRPDGEAQD